MTKIKNRTELMEISGDLVLDKSMPCPGLNSKLLSSHPQTYLREHYMKFDGWHMRLKCKLMIQAEWYCSTNRVPALPVP